MRALAKKIEIEVIVAESIGDQLIEKLALQDFDRECWRIQDWICTF